MATVFGNEWSETIDAADGVTNSADIIFGLNGNDTIFGFNGDDIIKGGGGADTIFGGIGSDTADYSDSNASVTVSLLTNTGFGGTAQGDTLNSIENLTGSTHADVLIGNHLGNVLKGGSGNDTLKGGGGADTLNGGNDTDTASYTSSSGAVFVSLIDDAAAWADAAGDELNDIENLAGSAHDDQLWGDNNGNTLWGNNGDDTLKGYGGTDTLYGGEGNDSLKGFGGADNLQGGNGNDLLDGMTGIDIMTGGNGDDIYTVDNAGDIVTELAGAGQGTNDVVYSNMVSYTLAANVEVLSLADSLVGINATGNAQSNTILGNANDNTLNGGASSDALSGLGGNDTFVFVAGQAQGDVIYEFQGNGGAVGDVIRFEGYGTLAEGATFHQLSATHWQVSSADGSITETIIFDGAYTFDTTTDLIFV